MSRLSWDEYFMKIAEITALRSSCDRAHVGAVLVSSDLRIISIGYNGSISGCAHCDDVGHLMQDGKCVRTIHAEQNAIASAARLGTSTKDSILYVTHHPCWICMKFIAAAGVSEVIYKEPYKKEKTETLLSDNNIIYPINIREIETKSSGEVK
jgi:dCMP deaminase